MTTAPPGPRAGRVAAGVGGEVGRCLRGFLGGAGCGLVAQLIDLSPLRSGRRSGFAVAGSPSVAAEGRRGGYSLPSPPSGTHTWSAHPSPSPRLLGVTLGFLICQIWWDLRVCVSNKLPYAAVAAALGTLILPDSFLRAIHSLWALYISSKTVHPRAEREFFLLPVTSGSFELRGHSLQVGRRVKREIYCYYLQHLSS